MIEFQYPYLITLLLLPILIYAIFGFIRSEKNNIPTLINPNIDRFAKTFGSKIYQSGSGSRFNFLLFLVWGCFTVAMMHPQKIDKIKKVKTAGYDIMMTLDLSRSMMALDMSEGENFTTRLDVVKSVAAEFMIERIGDRLGLVLFGDTAYLQSPLSSDVVAVASMLKYIEVGMAGDATAIGDALALSVKSLIERPEGSRIVVLLTDGSNTAGSILPEEAMTLAKKYDVKVYTIGVGKKGNVPFKLDDGRIIKLNTEMDEGLLKKIARETGGEYYKAEQGETLGRIYEKINKLEKTEAETNEIIIREQLYRYPLSIGLILYFLLFITKFKWRRLVSTNVE